MLPDPTVRTSLPDTSRVTNRPNGTEPARYAPSTGSVEITSRPGARRTSSSRRRRVPPRSERDALAPVGCAARAAPRPATAAPYRPRSRSRRSPPIPRAGSRGTRRRSRGARRPRTREHIRSRGREARSSPETGKREATAAGRRAEGCGRPRVLPGGAPRRRSRSRARRAAPARPRRREDWNSSRHDLRQAGRDEEAEAAGGAAKDDVRNDHRRDCAARANPVQFLEPDSGEDRDPDDGDEHAATGKRKEHEGSESVRAGGERRGKAALRLSEHEPHPVGHYGAGVQEGEHHERREDRDANENARAGPLRQVQIPRESRRQFGRVSQHPADLFPLGREEQVLHELADDSEGARREDGESDLRRIPIDAGGREKPGGLEERLRHGPCPRSREPELAAPLPRSAEGPRRLFRREGLRDGGQNPRGDVGDDERFAANRADLPARTLGAERVPAARAACEHALF